VRTQPKLEPQKWNPRKINNRANDPQPPELADRFAAAADALLGIHYLVRCDASTLYDDTQAPLHSYKIFRRFLVMPFSDRERTDSVFQRGEPNSYLARVLGINLGPQRILILDRRHLLEE
jgi:hypothetical protein